MAKTPRSIPKASETQAPRAVWSPEKLLDAVRSGTVEEKENAARQAGILDANGHLAAFYKNSGGKIWRSANYEGVVSSTPAALKKAKTRVR